MSQVLIVGEAYVDVFLHSPPEKKLRLGGLFHAARSAWAMGADFGMAYLAPTYLAAQAEDAATRYGAKESTCIGTVSGAPGVLLVEDEKEAGDQRYDDILRNERSAELHKTKLASVLRSHEWSDVFLLPMNCVSLPELIRETKHKAPQARIHIDLNDSAGLDFSDTSQSKIETLFASTSSDVFQKTFACSPEKLRREASAIANIVVLKENRGGARFSTGGGWRLLPAHPTPIVHSVGVGDSFDLAFISEANGNDTNSALRIASRVAAAYASTTCPDVFKIAVEAIVKDRASATTLQGLSLPWEKRPDFTIYIAAPDFDYLPTDRIDLVESSLRYHNFLPTRPIQTNGQASYDTPHAEGRKIWRKDMRILEASDLVIAFNEFDDPGTLIEIGIAHGRNIPVILFDPARRAHNLMLRHAPRKHAGSVDELISAVFHLLGETV